MSVQQLALHEAAHAIVARHYGGTVHEIRIGALNGVTDHSGLTDPRQLAAVTAAGEVGQRLGGGAFVDLACDDLARFEAEHGLGLLWRAEADAREILTARRPALLALAARLQRERVLVLGDEARRIITPTPAREVFR